jgi:NOL1/NOP2/fmu family ribosome biogenesis protein
LEEKNKMNFFKILNENEKKEIEKMLEKQFGIRNIPGIILRKGRERLFLFSGSLNKKQIKELEKDVPIERMGVYFAKIFEDGIRLSIEGTQLLKDQIKRNTFELEQDQMESWMKGQELPIKTGKKGFLIMKYKDDFLGTGKASEEKIGNFIPKSRRLKEKNI